MASGKVLPLHQPPYWCIYCCSLFGREIKSFFFSSGINRFYSLTNPQIYFGVSCFVIGKSFDEKFEQNWTSFIDGEIQIDEVIEIINEHPFL